MNLDLDSYLKSSRFSFAEVPFPPTSQEIELITSSLLGPGPYLGRAERETILLRLFQRTEFRSCGHRGMCWCWTGPTSGTYGRGKDYGRISYDNQTHAVHRLAFATIFGPIGPKKQIDHECRIRVCWNPYHLKKVTHLRNQRMRDQRQ